MPRTVPQPHIPNSALQRRSRAMDTVAEYSVMGQFAVKKPGISEDAGLLKRRHHMLNLLQSASDDQKALFGCIAALLAAGFVLTLSYYLSPARKQSLVRAGNTLSESLQPVRSTEDRAA